MNTDEERIMEAVERTEVLRGPKQKLATFGTTNVYYYLVTEPVYADLVENTCETVIREGRVITEPPPLVPPRLFSRREMPNLSSVSFILDQAFR